MPEYLPAFGRPASASSAACAGVFPRLSGCSGPAVYELRSVRFRRYLAVGARTSEGPHPSRSLPWSRSRGPVRWNLMASRRGRKHRRLARLKCVASSVILPESFNRVRIRSFVHADGRVPAISHPNSLRVLQEYATVAPRRRTRLGYAGPGRQRPGDDLVSAGTTGGTYVRS